MTKRKVGKHLQFYMDCMLTKQMPNDGLCICTDDCGGVLSTELLEMFTPSFEDCEKLDKEGKSTSYWASGTSRKNNDFDVFTELRQTIVLFMAAIADEL